MTILIDEHPGCQRLDYLGELLPTPLPEVDELKLLLRKVLPKVHAYEPAPRKAMRKQSPLNLWEVARGFSRRVPLMRLVQYESDVRPYLTALMIEAIRSAGETL